MSKLILILDDQGVRHDGFKVMLNGHVLKHACTASHAQELLDDHVFDMAFLDHDLGESVIPGNGMDVVHHILSMPEANRPKEVVVHSWNESAALRMVAELQAVGIATRRMPYKGPSK